MCNIYLAQITNISINVAKTIFISSKLSKYKIELIKSQYVQGLRYQTSLQRNYLSKKIQSHSTSNSSPSKSSPLFKYLNIEVLG